jgi:threonine/homoserine/homoserine lactone efflux protein
MDRELLTGYLAGNVDGLEVSRGFLLGAGVLVEIPIAMVLLSRVLKYRANRWANVAAGTVMTIVQLATLFLAGSPTMYYLFFSVIEIATTAYIVWLAWKWPETAARMEQRDTAVPAPTDAHIPHA